MANWKTYLGFFQSGYVPITNSDGSEQKIEFDNFFPVMEKEGEYFIQNFPHQDFTMGRLQIKQRNSEFGNHKNILIHEISALIEHNVLMVVSFDTDKFKHDEAKGDLVLLLDEAEEIEDGIRVENYQYEDVISSAYKVVVPVSELISASKYNSPLKSACALENKRLRFSSIPCVLHDGDYISCEIDARISLGFHKTIPWFDGNNVKNLMESSEAIEYGMSLPYQVDAMSWDSYTKSYTDVSEFELIELKKGAATIKGRLDNNREKFRLLPEKGAKKMTAQTAVVEPAPNTIDVVEQTLQFLRDCGRDVTKADVINYGICLTQGFITTFAGAPGTGKTTLCRLLAKAMGLNEEDGRLDSDARYAEISVERGWTSIKDFIGYPNPFPTNGSGTNDIIASNVDACNAFSRMNDQWQAENQDRPPYLMLLDEANLSPIEYYWSQFLKNCQLDDADELSKRKINVSQTESWKISPNLRFLATVNFDHTTEELSPRFLDRSWVVTLKAPENMLRKNKPTQPGPVPMETLEKLFGYPREGETFPEAIGEIWTQIQQAFKEKDVNMPLSPRNILAVENYCIAAARFDSEAITLEKGLDFAVLQKILPTITGYGARCERLVSSLLEITNERLPDTYQKLEEMRDAAETNSQFYQFFAR